MAGPERDTLVQSLKAAAAAIAAWAVSGWWFQTPMALLAPWTAIAMVGSTVYQSVRTGTQQFAIIALGTVWASGAMALTRDRTMAAMLLTLPFMMLLGNYRRFGNQGIYGATTALFVITAGVSSTSTVGHRLLETLIGAAIGLLVNAFVLPPVHLRSVRERRPSPGDGGSALEPGRPPAPHRPQATAGRRGHAWGRVCTRVLTITRTLGGIGDDPEIAQPPPDFFHQLSDALGRTARICALEAELLTSSASDTLRDDREAASREAWGRPRLAHRHLPPAGRNGGGRRRGGGGLLETRQLVTELDST
ncbi:aromatic acid exporter family protein [Streptomyces microflavus]|uniref:FUSC family protein n=1 Tax=Streptomyces microflavus TaxID=1919 RepID=UPI002DD93AF4|nr:FUSC family protein [Streptomyces microflavus]WSA64736.1 aromatic acid exporter family protein [Streptomyces microflavus]